MISSESTSVTYDDVTLLDDVACDVEAIGFDAVDDAFLSAWRQLAAVALEDNIFLSPDFVMPAVRRLGSAECERPFLVVVRERSRTRQLRALGIFQSCGGNRVMPLPHLQSWQCHHKFLDGILVDRQFAEPALTAFFEWFTSHARRWHGLAFYDLSPDSQLALAMQVCSEKTGLSWHTEWQTERAAIRIPDIPDDCLSELFSKSRRKTLTRNQRKLESRGRAAFRVERVFGNGLPHIETFMRLESLGWKGDQGSAMASTGSEAAFCREMLAAFVASGRAVFCELTVDEKPIVASVNLVSGTTLFAFKIGWDPEFSECSPGTLAELGLLLQAKTQLGALEMVDSCSRPGSYVEDIWPWKRKLVTGVFSSTSLGTAALRTVQGLKRLKRMWQS